MEIRLTKEQIRRPLGSGLSEEARRFFSRIGSVNFGDEDDEGFGVPDEKPIDFAALNRELDEADRRAHDMIMAKARGGKS